MGVPAPGITPRHITHTMPRHIQPRFSGLDRLAAYRDFRAYATNPDLDLTDEDRRWAQQQAERVHGQLAPRKVNPRRKPKAPPQFHGIQRLTQTCQRPWQAYVYIGRGAVKRKVTTGHTYATEAEAARARDALMVKLGLKGPLNFPAEASL